MSAKKKKDDIVGSLQNDTEKESLEEPNGKEDDKVGKDQPLPEQLKAAQAKADENYDRVLRITAEFENFKKRAEREMHEFRKYANESLMKEVLPVVDNLERALAADYDDNQETVKGLRDGIEMTLKGLLDTLERFGVVAIDALGKPFDPNFHQAVSQEETDRYPDNAVSQELQKGYLINDRLLRPAMVIVSKFPASREVSSEKGGSEGATKVKVTVH